MTRRKAMIENFNNGECAKKLCVYSVYDLNGQKREKMIASLYYEDINLVEISSVWNQRETEHNSEEFQLDFLKKLKFFAEGFTISKDCRKAKEFVDSWAEELGLQRVQLEMKRFRNGLCERIDEYDPNKYVWAWRFEK